MKESQYDFCIVAVSCVLTGFPSPSRKGPSLGGCCVYWAIPSHRIWAPVNRLGSSLGISDLVQTMVSREATTSSINTSTSSSTSLISPVLSRGTLDNTLVYGVGSRECARWNSRISSSADGTGECGEVGHSASSCWAEVPGGYDLSLLQIVSLG